MACYDIFNGDADGLCALHQLRLAEPRDCELVTGVKRDINLLERIDAASGDRITVLDVSLDKNRDGLQRALDAGAEVTYFDHHYAGDIPAHAALTATIDTSPETCTALLVDAHLAGRHRPWAVAGAFGDNFHAIAEAHGEALGYDAEQLAQLEQLGTCLNYNGYGVSLEDLLFHPADLYRRMQPYGDPFAFIAEEPAYLELVEGYGDDMARARGLVPERESAAGAAYLLPDAAWARRVGGVFGNELARDFPDRAHALLTRMAEGGYRVSVRAPLNRRYGADELCRAFPTGGGRQAAAGINRLEEADTEAFIEAFERTFAP